MGNIYGERRNFEMEQQVFDSYTEWALAEKLYEQQEPELTK